MLARGTHRSSVASGAPKVGKLENGSGRGGADVVDDLLDLGLLLWRRGEGGERLGVEPVALPAPEKWLMERK
jgi:hypothetical protein